MLDRVKIATHEKWGAKVKQTFLAGDRRWQFHPLFCLRSLYFLWEEWGTIRRLKTQYCVLQANNENSLFLSWTLKHYSSLFTLTKGKLNKWRGDVRLLRALKN